MGDAAVPCRGFGGDPQGCWFPKFTSRLKTTAQNLATRIEKQVSAQAKIYPSKNLPKQKSGSAKDSNPATVSEGDKTCHESSPCLRNPQKLPPMRLANDDRPPTLKLQRDHANALLAHRNRHHSQRRATSAKLASLPTAIYPGRRSSN